MAKVSKNQRPERRKGGGSLKMAKVMVAVKKENGHHSFKQKIVPLDKVNSEIKTVLA